MYERILITGGSGMVGKAVRRIVGDDDRYVFAASKDADLSDLDETRSLFSRIRPDGVIHLASKVGGLFYNINHNADILDCNTRINLNVTKCSVEYNVKKVILVNSTCAFPNNQPDNMFTEENLHDGPVHSTNEGYGASKRISEILGRLYSNSSDTKFVTVYPCNLYGPGDNFDLSSCHVLSGLMRRCHECKESDVDMVVWGTGKPLRQFLYVDDVARLLLLVLNEFDGESMILCNSEDELSINDLATCIKGVVGFSKDYINDISKSDGLYRKTVSNKLLLANFPGFQFTPLHIGLNKTYDWFCSGMYVANITGKLPGFDGITGGIGNQLFLIAAVMASSWDNNLKPFFRFDDRNVYSYKNDYESTFLGQFKFDYDEDLSNYKVVCENEYDKPCHENTVLEGYFQNPKYFGKYKDRIIDMFRCGLPEMGEYVSKLRSRYLNQEIIVVQVRRGDYLKLGWALPLKYYTDAMSKYPGAAFVISTDDKSWCESNFTGLQILGTDSVLSDCEEFSVLVELDGCIMSSSTYGWWVAYMGGMKNVVAPYPWVTSNKDVYLDGWFKQVY
jgi:GDP-L-fucose synthase